MPTCRILLIGRDPVFARMLDYELRRAGYTVAAPNEPADCCLLDLDTDPIGIPGLPAIGYSRTPDTAQADGCAAVLPRPFAVDRLLDCLSRIMPTEEAPPAATRIRRDDGAHALLRGTVRLPLTPAEYALFCRLADAGGEAVSRTELVAALPSGSCPDSNLLEVTVCTLRRKLEESFALRPIRTVRGVGYRYTE